MRRPACLICACIVLFAMLYTRIDNHHGELYYKAGDIVEITGVVKSITEKETGKKYSLEVLTDTGEKILVTMKGSPGNVRGSHISDYYDLTGRTVTFRSLVSLPSGRRNPECFDYRMYLRSIGIEVTSTIRSVQLEAGSDPDGLYYKYLAAVAGYRGIFTETLTETAGDEKSALICAMMFGDKGLIDDEMYEEFQKNGTAHVLAVSGLHVGAVYACVSKLIGKERKKLACIVNGSILLVYAAMASFAPSVMRAVTMIIIHMAGSAGNRRYDMLSASCVCMSVTLIRNPYMIYNTGFQMSYLAVLSIAIIGSALKEYVSGAVLPMLATQIGMVPATACLFNYFSLGAFLANIPIIILTGLIVPFGILLMILMPFCGGGEAAELLDVIVGIPVILSDIIIYINKFTYAGGAMTFDVVSPGPAMLVMYFGIVFGLCTESVFVVIKRREKAKIAAMLVFVVAVSWAAGVVFNNEFEEAGLVFVDVGQGDCLHIRSREGNNYLIDGGGNTSYDVGKNMIKPYLLKNGVKMVDMAFVTHLHTDHYKGIVELCNEGMIKKLCLYEGNIVNEEVILEETGLDREDIVYVRKGDVITLGKEVYAEVLSPSKMTEAEYEILSELDDENQNSLIIRLVYDDLSVLMTGDIDKDAERALVAQYGSSLDCTVLKAAHHGSKYSSSGEFLSAADPEVVVFQVGDNNYGHPDETLIEKLQQKGIMIYRNDLDGAIAFKHDRHRLRIITMQ